MRGNKDNPKARTVVAVSCSSSAVEPTAKRHKQHYCVSISRSSSSRQSSSTLLMVVKPLLVVFVLVALPLRANGHLVYLKNIFESIQPTADALIDAIAMEVQSADKPEQNNHLINDNHSINDGDYRTIVRHTRFGEPPQVTSLPSFYPPLPARSLPYVYAHALHSPLTWPVYQHDALLYDNNNNAHWTTTRWPSATVSSASTRWATASSSLLHKPLTTSTEKPYERAAGTQRYIDICAITTTGAYAVPGQAGGVQPFCPYGG